MRINLEDRVIGGFGVSIGTDVMLESLFTPTGKRYDESREIPNKIDPNSFDKHYYNLFTLTRNYLASYPYQDRKNIKLFIMKDSTLLDLVMEEVNLIASLYDGYKCKPVLFIPDYTKVYKGLNKDKEVVISDDNYMLTQYVTHYLKKKKYDLELDVVANTYRVPASSKKTMITTHIYTDLLNYFKIPNLYLLESHTGRLKDKKFFNGKYHPIGKLTLEVFPFIEELLYILGDKIISKPMKLGIRRELHKLAVDKKWSSYTNRLKVLQDINKNDILEPLIKNYKRVY